MRYFLIIFLLFTATVFADDRQYKADAAVANIIFDYDYGSEFASCSVSEDGFVDLIMARNTSDKTYSEVLARMQNHSVVDGVLVLKSSPSCKISNWK